MVTLNSMSMKKTSLQFTLAILCGVATVISSPLVAAKANDSLWKESSRSKVAACDEARFDKVCYKIQTGSKKKYCNVEMEITGKGAIKAFSSDSRLLLHPKSKVSKNGKSLLVKEFKATIFPDPNIGKDVLVSRTDLTKETNTVYFLDFKKDQVVFSSWEARHSANLDTIEFLKYKPDGEYKFNGCQ